jgi:hypothetical protein
MTGCVFLTPLWFCRKMGQLVCCFVAAKHRNHDGSNTETTMDPSQILCVNLCQAVCTDGSLVTGAADLYLTMVLLLIPINGG